MFTIDIKVMKALLKNIKPLSKTRPPSEVVFSRTGITYTSVDATIHYPVLNEELLDSAAVKWTDLDAVFKGFGSRGTVDANLMDTKLVLVGIDGSTVQINKTVPVFTPRSPVEGFVIEIDKVLIDVLVSIKSCAGVSDIRYYLNGVCLIVDENGVLVDLVANDGHCLGLYRNASRTGTVTEYILNNNTVDFIINNTATSIVLEKTSDKTATKKIQVNSSNGVLITSTTEGKYPDYMRVLPKWQEINDITIENQSLKELGDFATNCSKRNTVGKYVPINIIVDSVHLRAATSPSYEGIKSEYSTGCTYPLYIKENNNCIAVQSIYLTRFAKFFSNLGVDEVHFRTDSGSRLIAQSNDKIFFVAMPTNR